MEVTTEKRTILITGFGPFPCHDINASWEAVTFFLTSCQDLETNYNVKIIGLEIPVEYKAVSQLVPKLWSEHKPMFVIHVGVSGKAKTLTIESRAHRSGYVRPDVCDQLPDDDELQSALFYTRIDVKKLCHSINDNTKESGCKAVVSHNAGRFLCEYIFYKSLTIDSCVLFIHVPDLQVYSAKQTAQGLHYIVNYLLKGCDNSFV